MSAMKVVAGAAAKATNAIARLSSVKIKRRGQGTSGAASSSGPDPAHYELLEEIGSGGTGIVYHARDRFLDFDVAIKVVNPDLVSDPSVMAAFKDEARITMQLSHPNILRLYSFQSYRDCPYIVMELVRGESLHSAIARLGALRVRSVCRIVLQCAKALGYAHAHNVVHKDVKPENVFVAETGELKIVDFGSAVLNGALADVSGDIVGTPQFMAPEQLLGGFVGPQADIYALAIAAHLALTGAYPYPAGTTTDDFLSGNIRPDFGYLPEVLRPVFAKATAFQPYDRYDSAEVFAADFICKCGCPDVLDTPDEAIVVEQAEAGP